MSTSQQHCHHHLLFTLHSYIISDCILGRIEGLDEQGRHQILSLLQRVCHLHELTVLSRSGIELVFMFALFIEQALVVATAGAYVVELLF